METNSLIIIIILGFFALWLVTRNDIKEHRMSSGSVGPPRAMNRDAPGPAPWAPALINANAKAEGSSFRVPYDWIPTPSLWEPYASTRSVSRRLKEKAAD